VNSPAILAGSAFPSWLRDLSAAQGTYRIGGSRTLAEKQKSVYLSSRTRKLLRIRNSISSPVIFLGTVEVLALLLPYSLSTMGISLCMIVKNEQDWLAGAVDSVRSIVDEVIIVDTGSTDATRERAKSLGAEVLTHPWGASFADARNVSLAAARHSWVLVLDADERIAARDLPYIKDAIASGTADGFHLTQRNYVFKSQILGWTANTGEYAEGAAYNGFVDNPLIRLFRNAPELRFHGVVHEIIDPTRLPSHFKFGSLPVVMHHYGKVRGEQAVVAKQHHYLELGLKKVQDDPRNGKAFFDLGIQYQELGQHAEASGAFARAYEINKRPANLLYRAISEKHLRNYDSSIQLLRQAIAAGLDTVHVHIELGNIHLALNDYKAAQAEYAKCLKLDAKNPIAAFNQGLVLRKSGDVEKAASFYQRALALDPMFREPMIELAILHLQAQRPDEALSLLDRVASVDAIVLSLFGAAHLQKDNLEEARKYLETALRKDRSLTDARLNLAQVYTRKGDYARAARYMQSAGAVK
jgi:tetratricopeptide (TPR) repeat protein